MHVQWSASNAKSGEKIFLSKCAQCHAQGAARRKGPNWDGLFARRFAASPDCSYPDTNKDVPIAWDEATINDFLLDPKEVQYIPGAKMDSFGLRTRQDHKDLGDYLKEKKTCLSVSPCLISENNTFQMQSYIPRTWNKSLTSPHTNFPRDEKEKENPRCRPNHLINLLIGSIRALSMQGQLSEAFKSFSLLHIHSSSSADFSDPISSLLSVSTNFKALLQGKQLHAHIISLGLYNNPFLVSRLSSFYSAVGQLYDAKSIVQDSSTKHAFPWNIIISAYVRNGCWLDAVFAYKNMVERGCTVDKFTYPSVLKACSEIMDPDLGRVIHGQVEVSGLQRDLFICNALISMYAKWGMIKDARQLFNSMPEKDIVTWNSLISGYSSNGMWKDCSDILDKMQSEESKLNTITFNAIATINLRRGCHMEAFRLIAHMRNSNPPIDPVSLVIGLKSCSEIGHLRVGKEIHALALRLHSSELENVNNALITMYSRCKEIEAAYILFRMRMSKSLITWNAMITGFAAGGQEEETFLIFQEMITSQFQPNYVTIMTMLSLCSRTANLHYGRELHCYVIKHRLESYHLLGNSLINMYSKSRRILVAEKVFDMMSEHDCITYTSMIDGYRMQGDGRKALDLFEEMIYCGIKPDGTTMLAVLSACSHSGLVAYGEMLFGKMISSHDISPEMEHYSCMVDLFSRAGLLRNAEELIDQMPSGPSAAILATLIRACRAHGNVKIGERAAKRLLELGSDDPNHYVLIAYMFASCANWDGLARVKAAMQDMGIIEHCLLSSGLYEHMRDFGYTGDEDLELMGKFAVERKHVMSGIG